MSDEYADKAVTELFFIKLWLMLIFWLMLMQFACGQEVVKSDIYYHEVTLKPQLKIYQLSKRETIPFFSGLALSAISGAADAYHHMLTNHYSEFKRRHPGANDEYWDRRISWTKKYRDYPDDTRAAYFGSKTFLVWTTDGWHLTDMLARSTFTMGLTLNLSFAEWDQRPVWHGFVYAVSHSLVRNVVFEIVHP